MAKIYFCGKCLSCIDIAFIIESLAQLKELVLDLQTLQQQLKQPSGAPVDQWDPPFCGDIDMVIKRDGRWFYMGTPIGRQALVKLFASVLRKEKDNYFLVTPVEKIGIQVDDAPFIVVLMEIQHVNQLPTIIFTDNLDHQFTVDADHPIWVIEDPITGEPSPYVKVRDNLHALIHRNVFYQLVENAQTVEQGGRTHLVIESCGESFSLGCID
ncbi:DUF1285 domain-containing protein [Pleionea litopenaei]|uniref:DUF1285 domain-containing protein n=1 Tax=Pleionea litopenaei TaxID=3070815 RepID=A0AA51RRF0_9GAMM|nr:DUF1285 domain-containing protein [Pleionea sp. HL-JVS1]WMS86089.1 DUF1285 domain-containing protein [Pleionea sp. HL-JVS1]